MKNKSQMFLTNWRHLNVWVGPFLNSCWDPFLTNFVAFCWTFFWTFFGCFDSTCRKLDSHVETVSKQYCFNTFFQVMQKNNLKNQRKFKIFDFFSRKNRNFEFSLTCQWFFSRFFLVSKKYFSNFFKIFFDFEKCYFIFGKNILKSKIWSGIQKSYLENRTSS